MNLACFLPPDAKAYAPAIGSGSFPSGSGRRLLRPRDADKTIRVYDNYSNGQPYPVWVGGNEIACYAVLEQYPEDSADPDWYKIRHSELDSQGHPTGNTIEGWVSRTVMWPLDKDGDGKFLEYEVVWVHVEEAPATEAEVQTRPHFLTTDAATVTVHSLPTTNINETETVPELGLAPGCHTDCATLARLPLSSGLRNMPV